MRRFAILAIFMQFLCAAASAKDVTVTYSDAEQKALWEVFDAALKSKGMELGGNVAFLWQKLREAAEKQNPVVGGVTHSGPGSGVISVPVPKAEPKAGK